MSTDNIDYEEIKHFIKENTTPGNGKALAIPGGPNELGKGLEDALFEVLREQHERITFFVRSKTGEIRRRLSMCSARGVPPKQSLKQA